MKTLLPGFLLWAAILLPATLSAQFSSGSNGSYGPLNVTSGTVTLTVPADGIFHCTTINVTGGLLKFTPNAKNTPVYLLATGDVTISSNISVDGSPSNNATGGKGGPGGYVGGNGAMGGLPAGDGQGPGGGKAGDTTFGTAGSAAAGAYGAQGGLPRNGAAYGNALLIPLVGGSGGGGTSGNPGEGGGGGGGAILIASNTKIRMTNNGAIYAEGGNGGYQNEGSGGAIRLVAPDVVLESGFVLDTQYNSYAGSGRVRIDGINRQIANFFNVSPPYSVGANMVVFPANMPELRIVTAAGQAVDPDAAAPVTVILPTGSSPNQQIRVRARNFSGTAQLVVQLTPESGSVTTYNLDIPNPGPGAAEAEVGVTFPINVLTRVDVWTR